MNKYSQYKDSGVEWVGEIPSAWKVIRIKYLVGGENTLFIDGNWIESNVIIEDGIRYITTGNIGVGYYKEQGLGHISEETFKLLNCTEVFAGDLLISRLNLPIGRCCIVPNLNNRIVTSVDNVILRPNQSASVGFLKYLFSCKEYFEHTELIARGATMQRISRGLLGNVKIPLPPIIEQTQIAQYLDRKTSQIDKLISDKQKLIELLNEERTAVINQAVTKGLNPAEPMKDSGIGWLGQIPQHWSTKRLRYLAEIIPSNVDKKSYENEQDVLLCNYTDVYKNDLISSSIEFMKATASDVQIKKLTLRKNDVIATKDSEDPNDIGVPALVIEDFENVVCGYHLTLFRCYSNNDFGRFLFWFLKSKMCSQYFSTLARGITRYALGTSAFKNLPIPLPATDEAIKDIADFLESKTTDIAQSICNVQREIELLKEYKTALISEAVTGKIDVREELPTELSAIAS